MAEPGVVSLGIGIGYKVGAAPSYTAIPRVFSIKKPGRTVEPIDATHHKSLAKEFLLPKLENYGDVNVSFNWMPADETWIETLIGAKASYEISLPDGSTITFDGLGTGYEPADSTVDGKEEATLTIKVTGLPEFEAGV